MSVASSDDAGLPSADPSRSSMESQLSTRESGAAPRNGGPLALGEHDHGTRRADLPDVLAHPTDHNLGIEPGVAQDTQTRR